MNPTDQKYLEIAQEPVGASMEFNVEELNIVDLDDRLELAERCTIKISESAD